MPFAKNKTISHTGILITIRRSLKRTPESFHPPTASSLFCIEAVISNLILPFTSVYGSATRISLGFLGHPHITQAHESQSNLPYLQYTHILYFLFFFMYVWSL